MRLHRVRRLTLTKSMHSAQGRVKPGDHRPGYAGRGREETSQEDFVAPKIRGQDCVSDLESSERGLAGHRNSGEGEEYGAPHRLSKDLRRGKNTEKQRIFQLGTGLGIRASGDDLVVVHPAFSVDESLNNDRVVTDPQRLRRARGRCKGNGGWKPCPRGSSRASSGSGDANIPMSSATPPSSATVLAKPAVTCHTRGRKVFCQRTRPRASFSWAVLAASCDRATRSRRPRLGGAFAGPMELISDCAFRHCANSAAQPEQASRCAAISCMAAPVTAPSRYAENCSRK